MALDLSIVKTENRLNLGEVYAVFDIITNNMDWYLGDDKHKRHTNYEICKAKFKSLTLKDILRVLNDDEYMDHKKLAEYLLSIPYERFMSYLNMIGGSINEFSQENSHMSFNYEKLPGKSLHDTCSWSIYDLFKNCQQETGLDIPEQGDSVIELSPEKLRYMYMEWKEYGTTIFLAKWIGYFFPNVGDRIAEQLYAKCWREYDILGLEYCRKTIIDLWLKEMSKAKPTDRFWMISSY